MIPFLYFRPVQDQCPGDRSPAPGFSCEGPGKAIMLRQGKLRGGDPGEGHDGHVPCPGGGERQRRDLEVRRNAGIRLHGPAPFASASPSCSYCRHS